MLVTAMSTIMVQTLLYEINIINEEVIIKPKQCILNVYTGCIKKK